MRYCSRKDALGVGTSQNSTKGEIMEEWEIEISKEFLKVEEGDHKLLLHGPPVPMTNNFGKKQWLFEDADLDDVEGKITPPMGLLKLISQVKEEKMKNGSSTGYPLLIEFTRIGMDIDSEFRIQGSLDES